MNDIEQQVIIELTTDKNNAAVVRATLWSVNDNMAICDGIDELLLETRSVALRHPGDKFDAEVGYNLAIGRALENLGRKLQKRALGKTRHNEEVKLQKNSNTNKKREAKIYV